MKINLIKSLSDLNRFQRFSSRKIKWAITAEYEFIYMNFKMGYKSLKFSFGPMGDHAKVE